MTSTIIARANTGWARMRRSTIGVSLLSVCRTKPIATIALAASGTSADALPNPSVPPCARPMSSSTIALPAPTSPAVSSRRGRPPPVSRSSRIASGTPMMPMGTFTRKSHRQPISVITVPPSTGPIAGAAITATPQIPSARPRSSGSKSS